MDRRTFLTSTMTFAAGAALPGLALAADPAALPQPSASAKSLLEALKARHTNRSFLPDPLPAQVISDLLWHGFGVNRADSGRRTAPSYKNWQEIDIYAATAQGLFLYNAKAHSLTMVLDKDIRALTGKQDFVATAPLNLVYVADYTRMSTDKAEERLFASAADTGFISQNVYLFCAVQGLATVVRANIDKEALAKAMGLKADQGITLAQTVGYPKV